MNLTYFHHKRTGNVENKSYSLVNIRFVMKTSDILSKHQIYKHQKWQHW